MEATDRDSSGSFSSDVSSDEMTPSSTEGENRASDDPWGLSFSSDKSCDTVIYVGRRGTSTFSLPKRPKGRMPLQGSVPGYRQHRLVNRASISQNNQLINTSSLTRDLSSRWKLNFSTTTLSMLRWKNTTLYHKVVKWPAMIKTKAKESWSRNGSILRG